MTTPLSRTFLAYVRQGLAAQITQPASETATLPARGDLTLGIRVNARPQVTLDLQTYGPGDVIGFDEGQIVRTEPAPDTQDFEADLLAAIEFARPDLPWLLTPAAPDPANGRIQPWLLLVVVTQDASTVTATPGIPLPVLSCPTAELPDLTESWAWAHAQVTGPPGAAAGSLLATPGAAVSRLICPRRLYPFTGYYACVVPAFQAGVLAGLGQPVPAGNLAPAWGTGSPATVQLPVYYHWSFATGASGDFATLAARLRPMAIQDALGLRDIDISAADPEIVAPDATVIGMPGAASGATSPDTVPADFQSALETVIAGGATGVGPPVYGGLQAGTGARLPAVGQPRQWLRDLNLDPRNRAAAGLGTQVVQGLQEQLVAGAWAQAADLAQANALLRNGQLARANSAAWYRKHLPTASSGPQADRLVQLTGPAHARVRPAGAALTVSGQESASAPVAATVSVPYRRAARPLGPLARRLGATPAAPLPPPLTAMTTAPSGAPAGAPPTLVVTGPQPAPAGLVTLDSIAAGSPGGSAPGGSALVAPVTYRGITPQLVSGSPAWWEGAAAGFAAPPTGFFSDLIVFRANGSVISWRVGQHLDFAGQVVTGWQAEQSLAATQAPPQVVAGTVFRAGAASANAAAAPALAAIWIEQPTPPAPRTFQLKVGTGVGPAGVVTSWAPATPVGTATTAQVLGADVLVADIGTTAPALLLIWVEQEPAGTQTAQFLLVPEVGGPLPGQASPPITLPFTPSGDLGIAGGVIGPAGNSPDVLVWWIEGAPGSRAGRYCIGWQFGPSGPTSWSAPMPVPGPLPDTTVGLGAALADISCSGRPDLVLYYIAPVPAAPGTPPPEPAYQGSYLIGWDLAPDGVPAGGWSPMRDVPGDWTFSGAGGSASIASLDPARLTEISTTGAAFQQQAALLQQALLSQAAEPAPGPVAPQFTSGQLADALHGALDPAVTVPARLLPQIQLAGTSVTAPGAGDPLAPLVLTPSFPQPMYIPLRGLAGSILLPSASAVPPDNVTLLQADPAFIESYLVGLNHEMSRVLAWRGFPADGAGTYFQYFWDRPPGSTSGPDIPPISGWDPTAPLGAHSASVGASGMLMLLVRGALPTRWPNLIVRASQAAFAGPGSLVKNPTDMWLDPVFHGRVEPDLSFYGFALTAAAARSTPGSSTTSGNPGWFFVFSERPFEPRFGLEPVPQPPVYGGAPAHWADLTWGEMATNASSYAALSQLSASAPPPALSGLTLDGVTFGHNAAHMAAIALRLPFQVAIHADEMLAGL